MNEQEIIEQKTGGEIPTAETEDTSDAQTELAPQDIDANNECLKELHVEGGVSGRDEDKGNQNLGITNSMLSTRGLWCIQC